MARLLDSLREAGAQEQATALADRAAAHVSLDNPDAVARLLDSLREAGAQEQATALAERAAAHVSLDNPAPWPGCWAACGRRARRSRPPRWPIGCQLREGLTSSSVSPERGPSLAGNPMATRPSLGTGPTWTDQSCCQPPHKAVRFMR